MSSLRDSEIVRAGTSTKKKLLYNNATSLSSCLSSRGEVAKKRRGRYPLASTYFS